MSFRYDDSGVHLTYDAARELPDEARQVWSDAIREHLGPDRVHRVLDLGCGTGRFSGLLRECLSAQVYAIDPSADMLGTAAAKPELGEVRLVRGRAEAIPLRAGAVDAVFVYLVYHHIEDKRAALAESARVLAPRGQLMVCTPTQETLDSFLWMRFLPTAYRIDRDRMPLRAELVEAARVAGLEIQCQSTVRRAFTRGLVEYADRIGMRAFSTLRLVPDTEFDAGMRALRRYAAERERGETIYEDIDVFVFRPFGAG
jgi:ubiquinone/menaquinone biosynthesis C-methylase UbiE